MYSKPLPRLRRANRDSRSDTYLKPAARADDSGASSLGPVAVPGHGRENTRASRPLTMFPSPGEGHASREQDFSFQ